MNILNISFSGKKLYQKAKTHVEKKCSKGNFNVRKFFSILVEKECF
jgi:hypothetical protein